MGGGGEQRGGSWRGKREGDWEGLLVEITGQAGESRKERGDRGGHVWVCDLEGGVSSPRDRKMGRVV